MRYRIRFEKREKQTALRTLITSIIFVALALVFCGCIILSVGFEPMEVYKTMITKTFLSQKGIENILTSSLPLMFCSLGVALTFKMNLNNIGAEGQYAMGVIAGGAFVFYGPKIEGMPGILLLAVCCFAGGALWALLCAIPKALWDVNESITTLMMNYVALTLLTYLCMGPWKKAKQNTARTESIPKGLELPNRYLGTIEFNVGIILGIVIAVVIFCAYKYTTSGYQLSVISHSPKSAKYAGISIKKNILTVLSISGGLAGLAGFVQYAGVSHKITGKMTNNTGYTAIVIAYLSRLNPLMVVPVSVLLGGLQYSTIALQKLKVSFRIANMMQGAIMLFVIAAEFFQKYKIVVTKEDKA